MSDVDRRRYKHDHEGMVQDNKYGEWYHESAVRELVWVVVQSHFNSEGVANCAYVPGPCAICDLLSHYKDLWVEVGDD